MAKIAYRNFKDASHIQEFQRDWPGEALTLEHALSRPAWIAVDNGIIIGLILFDTQHAQRGWTSILDFWVDPSYRGQGLGTSLLNAALQEQRSLGAGSLTLTVSRRNRTARKIYEAAGFRVTELIMSLSVGDASPSDGRVGPLR